MNGRPQTIAEMLEARAAIHPGREFLRCGEVTLTYREMAERADAVASGLLRSGVGPGSRVGVLSEHSVALWELLLGCCRLGAVPVLVNTRLAPPEIDAVLSDAQAAVVLCSDTFAALAPNGQSLSDFCAASKQIDPLPRPPGRDDDAVQLYTSGTTGLPKGVRTSHRNIVELLAAVVTEVPGMGTDSVHLVAAPPFHIAGFGYGLLALTTGAVSVLLPAFEPAAVLKAIESERCTSSLLVPAMLQAVVEHPDCVTTDLSSMRSVLYGGSPMPASLMRTVVERLDVDLTQAYGLTETTGFATLLRWDDHRAGMAAPSGSSAARSLLSAGAPVPGTEVVIIDESGVVAPAGCPGEVIVRGPTVMAGYWNRPKANAQALDADGWFHTGDIGFLESGQLFLVDRLGDKIVTKGENVFPGEVEQILADLPEIAEVAIIAVPDDDHGECLCAVVRFRAGAALTLRDLQDACRGQIAGYKVPRRLVVADEPLPRTPSGKMQRRLVREPFWAGHERRVN